MTPLVLGIDTKTRAFHWVASGEMPPLAQRYGWVSQPEREDPEVSRLELLRAARQFFVGLPSGSSVFCEEPLALQNGRTTRLLNLAAGAIWSAFMVVNPDATWHWVDNVTWKREVLGRGSPPNRGKHKPWIEETLLTSEEFVGWLHQDLGSRADFLDQTDLYDAWCLMRYGVGVVHSLHGRA